MDRCTKAFKAAIKLCGLSVVNTISQNINSKQHLVYQTNVIQSLNLKESIVLSMQILVTVPSGDQPGEWTIIELQGDLESRELSTISGKFIGDLHYSNQGIPILIIGHHILHGKVVQLDKPLAIIEKVNAHDSDHKETKKPVSFYSVKAIVSKKLLFKTRPKPIIANLFSGPA